jgi:hypothetical protein
MLFPTLAHLGYEPCISTSTLNIQNNSTRVCTEDWEWGEGARSLLIPSSLHMHMYCVPCRSFWISWGTLSGVLSGASTPAARWMPSRVLFAVLKSFGQSAIDVHSNQIMLPAEGYHRLVRAFEPHS